jgi:aminoglycoside 6'-N-acetyltransferase
MPAEAAHAIAFRPVAVADLDLIAGWLAAPHVRQWWGEPETEIAGIRDMVEGRDPTRPFLILAAGEPVGYIQVWSIAQFSSDDWTSAHPWLLSIPEGSVGIDLLVGDPGRIEKGLGSAALASFAEKLRAEGNAKIVIDPDPANRRAIRAFEKAGFRVIPELEGASDEALPMRYEPDRLGRPKADFGMEKAR